jgi:glutaminase
MSSFYSTIVKHVDEIYESLKDNTEGDVASYIPQLKKVNPDLFGISINTIIGESYDIGDTDIDFCLQSASKPILYCIARQLHRTNNIIHNHVGYEPSGRRFNAFVLNDEEKPHNPLINAGAIMISSLISPDKEPAERFDIIKDFLVNMSGRKGKFECDISVFLSERDHADRNRALAYFINENNGFPEGTDIDKTLEFYFQACSILCNCKLMASVASTLANSGICPSTGLRVFDRDIVRDCLSLMYSCGMYDYSGRFAFKIGLPAKSGVSGCLMLVVPNVMGVCIWSPRLDEMGNSVKGVKFCKQLIAKNPHFHIFNNLMKDEISELHELQELHNDIDDNNVVNHTIGHNSHVANKETDGNVFDNLDIETINLSFITAASKNNVNRMKEIKDYDKYNIDINFADYDGRTAMHLAAIDGCIDAINILLEWNGLINIKDRWGNTALSEARNKMNEFKDENGQNYNNYKIIYDLILKKSEEKVIIDINNNINLNDMNIPVVIVDNDNKDEKDDENTYQKNDTENKHNKNDKNEKNEKDEDKE